MNRAEQIIEAAWEEWCHDNTYELEELIVLRLREAGIDLDHTYTECRDGDDWRLTIADTHERDHDWSTETQWVVPDDDPEPGFRFVFVRRPLDGEG